MLCLRMKMASIILSTKLCIIQFYAKVLAFVKSDLTSHPQVAIFLRGILSKYLPEKLKAWDRGWGEGGKTCISENVCPFYTKFCTVLTVCNKS